MAYVAYFKSSLKLGLRKRKFPNDEFQFTTNNIFNTSKRAEDFNLLWRNGLMNKADEIMRGIFTYFSYHKFDLGENPNWFSNPFDKSVLENPSLHWMEYGDFNLNSGDVKIIWELSRFDWVTVLARAYKVSGEEKYLIKLNTLLVDWCKNNPINVGPNWKCGQETSFRLMKLLTTAFVLDQLDTPSSELVHIIKTHVNRIEQNILYALAQANNHGTSESIGLYIGSAWLMRVGDTSNDWNKSKRKGRIYLEKSIMKLIQVDGSFSQRSTNYHRVVMDTISFCLHMMKVLKEKDFSTKIHQRLIKLGQWQYKVTFGKDGQVPNLGNNDGAKIDNLNSGSYTDFRYSTQLFFALLVNKIVYKNTEYNESLYWRKVQYGEELFFIERKKFEILDNLILLISSDKIDLLIKIPDDKFRPGNDAFHIDFWMNGESVLIDAGSFSYNSTDSNYFKSVVAHNTVQFGDQEQMPKLSRFLNAQWVRPDTIGSVGVIENGDISWTGSYSDFENNRHSRSIILSNSQLRIVDNVRSPKRAKAIYHISDKKYLKYIRGKEYSVKEAFVSKFYMNKEKIPSIVINSTERDEMEFTFLINYNEILK